MTRTLTLSCASAMPLALATPAMAQQQFSQDRTVQTSDVDAFSARGADTVLNRIENAAEAICGDRPRPMPTRERQDVNACTYETVDIAVAESGNGILHQRYFGYEPRIVLEEDDYYNPSLSPKGSRQASSSS